MLPSDLVGALQVAWKLALHRRVRSCTQRPGRFPQIMKKHIDALDVDVMSPDQASNQVGSPLPLSRSSSWCALVYIQGTCAAVTSRGSCQQTCTHQADIERCKTQLVSQNKLV